MTTKKTSSSAPTPIDCQLFRIIHPTEPPTNSHGQTLQRSARNCKPNKAIIVNHVLNAVINPETGKLEEYWQPIKRKDAKEWIRGNMKEIARLCQGRNDGSYEGTNTIVFKHPNTLPQGKKATYFRAYTNNRPTKEDHYRIC